MTKADADVLRRASEASGRGDVDAAVQAFDPQVRRYGADEPDGEGACHNRDDVAAFIQAALADSAAAESSDVREAGDRLVAIIETRTLAAAGEFRFELHGEVVTVLNRRITEIISYPTVEGALIAAGLPVRP